MALTLDGFSLDRGDSIYSTAKAMGCLEFKTKALIEAKADANLTAAPSGLK